MASKISEIRAEVVGLLRADTTLRSLLGTNGDGDTPVYHSGEPVGRSDKNFLVYELRTAMDEDLSREGRRFAEMEITCEVVQGTTPTADVLDEVEETLDTILQDYRGDTTNREVKRCVRSRQAIPAFASDQGAVARSWTWEMVIDDV